MLGPLRPVRGGIQNFRGILACWLYPAQILLKFRVGWAPLSNFMWLSISEAPD